MRQQGQLSLWSSFSEINSCKIMFPLRNHRGRVVRDILAQTSADGKNVYRHQLYDSLVIRTNGENNGKSTGVYRTFSQNRGLLGAATPQLCQTRQGDTACAFHMSPTALEISESNLATFFRKLRQQSWFSRGVIYFNSYIS